MIYPPSEDSFFLQKNLKKILKKQKKQNKEIKILDMGTGSGIQAKTCFKLGFNNILAVDIDKQALKFVKKKNKKTRNQEKTRKIKTRYSNLFSNIKTKEKFNLIVFNPPYLPKHKYDNSKNITGGKKGYETILKFLKQARKHLTNQGKILLLVSSLSKPRIIRTYARKHYSIKTLDKKKLFFETLEVWLLKNKEL